MNLRVKLFCGNFLRITLFSALFVSLFSIFSPQTATAADTWWDASWSYRLKITIDNSGRAENLTDFPIAVNLNSTRVDYANFNSDASDIRFVETDGSTVLDHEIERWNTAGTTTIWVRVPQIDSASSTDYIYMYYGNSGATTVEDPTGVWDTNFINIYHFDSNPAGGAQNVLDSTSNARHATSTNITATTSGIVGDSFDFGGTNTFIETASTTIPMILPAGTVEIWFNPDTITGTTSGRYLFSRVKSGAWNGEWRLYIDSATSDRLTLKVECGPTPAIAYTASTTAPSITGGWYNAVAVWDKNGGIGNMKLYNNNVLAVETTATSSPNCGMEVVGETNSIGRNNALRNGNFDGQIDEFRISSTTRSANWISATYATVVDTLLSYGATSTTPTAPTGFTAVPHNGKMGLYWNAPSGTITDYAIDYKEASAGSFSTFSDGVSTATSTAITGLTNGTSYVFRVSAINSDIQGTSTNPVAATPVSVIDFISPTISASAATSSTNITVYASTTLTSTTSVFTFAITNASSGALVSYATSANRYGDFNIAHLSTTTNKENLSLTGDLSGVAYASTTDTLFTIHNNQNVITEITRAGAVVRTITCSSCNDAEDITLISSTASSTVGGYDHVFMISTEDVDINNLQIFRVSIHSTGSVTVDRTSYYSTGIAASTTNNGLEGLAYNTNTGTFFAGAEGQDSSSAIPKLYEVTTGNIATHTATSQRICANINFRDYAITNADEFPASVGYADISGLYFEPTNNHLYVLSHMGDKLLELDVTSTSTCTFVREKRVMTRVDNGSNFLYEMPEGITWDSTGDYLYLGTEADYWSVWRTTDYDTRKTFTGVADGSYNLYAGVTDIYGITSTSSARAFSVDTTRPSITSIASSTTSTTATITWTTNEAATSTVDYGTTISYGSASTSDNLYTDHSISLTGLAENTLYHFRIGAADAAKNSTTTSDYTFRTGDTTAPTITSVSSDKTNGTYGVGEVIDLDVTFSEAVTSTGNVTVTLETGDTDRTCTFTVSNSSTGTCNYTVQSTDNCLDLTVSSISGTIADQASNAMASFSIATNLAANKALVIDAVGPTFSSIASSTSATTATVSWNTNESSNSKVSYGTVSGTYTTSTSSATLVTTGHSLGLISLSDSTIYYYVVVSADALGNYATSSEQALLTTDTTAPTISALASTTSSTSGTVTWTTNELASSQVIYGATSNYRATTTEADTSPRVTSHSVTISDLLSCTTYHFKAVSRDVTLNGATSSAATLTTTGCTGNADIEAIEVEEVVVSAGGNVVLDDGDQTIELVIPASVTGTSSLVTFQAKFLDENSVVASAGSPSGVSIATGHVYDLKAIYNATNTIATFNNAITIILTYSDSDISGLDESTLKIYRYDGSSWSELSSCTVDASANTITCTTTAFSTFGLFGTATASASSDSSTPAPLSTGRRGREVAVVPAPVAAPVASPVPISAKPATLVFKRNLLVGSNGEDVRMLQKVLNLEGFTIAVSGPGSKGNETTYFGKGTEAALKLFQAKFGIAKAGDGGFGRVGPKTMALLNSMVGATPAPATPTLSPVETPEPVGIFQFTKLLVLGDVSSDVKKLQEILNKDKDTKVAESGSGSLGQETTRFGQATLQAVKKFQIKFGIAKAGNPGFGDVGPKTRSKLNMLLK